MLSFYVKTSQSLIPLEKRLGLLKNIFTTVCMQQIGTRALRACIPISK